MPSDSTSSQVSGTLATVPDPIRRKVALRLLPYVFLLYIVAFLDRVNVSYAALGMRSESWFNSNVLGFGAGIFFIGYVVLEIPSTVMVERWSARKWMARIMITWGLIASAMGFVTSANQFYVGRFFLGLGEAGFFPGMIVYLSHWFTERDRAKAIAMFYTAVPLSYVVGSPLAAQLMKINWHGLPGWRWLFILEGIPAVVLGVLNLWLLTDWPKDAHWLKPAERTQLQSAIDSERHAKPSHLNVLGFLTNRTILMLTLIYFFAVCGSYGFGIWLPTMLKQFSGLPDTQVALLAAVPYVVSLVCVVIGAWSSDRTQERVWHTSIPLFVMAVGLAFGTFFHLTSMGWIMVGFCIIGAGVYTYIPAFWALPAKHLSGTAAAVSVGIINSFGNLGGFAGPYLMGWLQTRTKSFETGMGVLLAFQVIAALLVLTLRKRKA
ncbi:MAG: MFS transporter [Vicinamibacterales bacterium]